VPDPKLSDEIYLYNRSVQVRWLVEETRPNATDNIIFNHGRYFIAGKTEGGNYILKNALNETLKTTYSLSTI